MIDSTRRSPEETFIAERKNQFRLAVGTSNLLDVVSQTIESLLLDKYMYQRIEDWPNDDIKTLISIRTRARELANLSTNGVTKRLETIAHFIGMNLHMEVSNKEKRIQKREKSERVKRRLINLLPLNRPRWFVSQILKHKINLTQS
jgi:hypothetical protein